MGLENQFIEAVRKSTRIEDIISEHVVLRKSGSNLVGLCPFHGERTPSLNVSPSKQLYHCYGCKAGGDVFRFLMDIFSLSFPEAVSELAARAKIPLPKDFRAGPDGRKDSKEAEMAYRLNRFAAKFYRDFLGKNADVLQHLKQRGVSPEMQAEFYVGLAPPQWDGLSERLTTAQAPIDLAEKIGLIKKGQTQGHFDLLRNRVVFPILDERARICGFGGRSLGEEMPKYLNSSESLIFQKSGVLFGLHQARPHIRETDTAILVEGYFDVLALHSVGLRNVVATCGTAVTDRHLKRLAKVCKRIVLLLDSDSAGKAGAVKAMETALPLGMILLSADLPEGVDPDEFVLAGGPERGPKRLQAMIDGATPLLDQMINDRVVGALKGPEAKAEAIRQIQGWLQALADPVGRQVRVRDLAQRLGVPPQVLVADQPKVRPPRTAPGSVASPPLKLSRRDRLLFRSLLNWDRFAPLWGHFLPELPSQVDPGQIFESVALRPQALQILQNPGFDLRDPALSDLLLDSTEIIENEVRLALSQALSDVWARFSHGIREEMRAAEARGRGVEVDRLLQVYLDAQKKMKEFNGIHDQFGASPDH